MTFIHVKWRIHQRGQIFTARKRSLGQGNMFTGMCLSTGRVPGQRGACSGGCLLQGGLVWVDACSGGVPGPGGALCGGYLVWGVPGPEGACSQGGAWDGYCCGWYASHWNAFLFNIKVCSERKKENHGFKTKLWSKKAKITTKGYSHQAKTGAKMKKKI